MDKIAVVILNYNGKEFLRKFLPNLIKFSAPYKIYVADNHSTDESVAVIQNDFPEIEIIVLEENYGYAGGYNEALKQIKAAFYLLINSDVEVTPNWIPPLLKLLEETPNSAAVQPKIRSYHEKELFEHAGAAGGMIDPLGYPFCRGRLFNYVEKDVGQYDNPQQIFWSTGACFLISSDVFWEAGGFDPSFFAHMEEIDLCWRINNMGYSVHYQPDSVVYHVGGGTLSMLNPKKTYLNFRNGLALIYKNMALRELLYKLPIRLALDGVALLRFALMGEFNHALAVLKATRDFWWRILTGVNKRKVKGKSAINKGKYFQKLIVYEFYVRNNRKFSDIE